MFCAGMNWGGIESVTFRLDRGCQVVTENQRVVTDAIERQTRAEVEGSWLWRRVEEWVGSRGSCRGCVLREERGEELGSAVTSVAGENHRRGEESDNTDGCVAGPLCHQKGDGGLRATSPRPLLCRRAMLLRQWIMAVAVAVGSQSARLVATKDDSKIYGIPRLPTGGQGKWTQPRDFGRGRNVEFGGNDVAGEVRLSTAATNNHAKKG